ncbi:MAG: hypothetical protein JXA73_12330 [Acidobacteria bacterium]|nr:hypothetical protein [Acidobacteriota bacterium]
MIKLLLIRLIKIGFYVIAAIFLVFPAGQAQPAKTSSPVVRGILFTSPTCGHCAYVREEVLPPLISRHGSRLQIAILSTATQTGHELFLAACMKHGLLRLSVPLLIVGNTAMVGSDEIPAKLPDLIEKQLAAGGVDWPKIPGLSTLLAANPAPTPEATLPAEPAPKEPPAVASASPDEKTEPAAQPPSATTATARKEKPAEPAKAAAGPVSKPSPVEKPTSPLSERAAANVSSQNTTVASTAPLSADLSASANPGSTSPSVRTEPSGIIDLTGGEEEKGVIGRIKRDIYGNGLSILVLTGMIITLLVSPRIFRKSSLQNPSKIRPDHDWLIPILILVGLGVAAYLSHIEVSRVEAVCGPVGDCNTVNQSEYARLFGILPIGVLGMIGFLAILAAWAVRRWGSRKISLWAAVAILAMTAFGTLFSAYLTFLEPFVIGATCLWCLSSAVIMTTLFVLALKPGRQALSALKSS